jgi:hypothetical protein
LYHWGDNKRALKTPFLAINAKGGESISPKQNDRTTTPISNFFGKLFSIGIFQISIPIRNSISIDIEIFKGGVFQNRYIKHLIFFQMVKTLLNTKRIISLRGSFV